ncbi:unnamed protein product [Rotaria sordida]|uniref:Uncharacterized protein n=2 Tax=Rotaria sordida TaxID=392033 RepID=A0A819WI28_9BILA|nr:unnamed protein product [Rotaria sordida]
MKSTNFCKTLSLLYGILLHQTNSNNQTITGNNNNNNNTVTLHGKTIIIIVTNSIILLNTIATLDLDSFQVKACQYQSKIFQQVSIFILLKCKS